MPSSRGGLLGHAAVLLLPFPLHGGPLPPTLGVFREHVESLPSDTNRCSDPEFTQDIFNRICGAPLSSPCFDFSRCSRPSNDQDIPSSNYLFGGVGGGGGGGGGESDESGVKIYVFDNECTLSDSDLILTQGPGEDQKVEARYTHALSWVFRNAAREAGILAPTYESACMFIHLGWGESKPCPINAPLWNNGSNHVMINFGDGGR